MFIWFCISVFIFILRQNWAIANSFSSKTNYNSTSMTEFINQKTIDILSKNIDQAKQKYQTQFDLNDDYSLQKYLSDTNLLLDKKYAPMDLQPVDETYITNKSSRPYLRQPAVAGFKKMSKDFYNRFNQKFYLVSAYRTYYDQAALFEGWCSSIRCAKIWWSEHQLWLAIDIHVSTEKWYKKLSGEYLDRLNENAYKYWFINTYRKGAHIDGKVSEVWHWRYVWEPFAKELTKKDLTFAEYYKLVKSLSS